MRRILPLVVTLAAASAVPGVQAQAPRQVFTRGSASELARARSLALEHLKVNAPQQGIRSSEDLVVSRVTVDHLSMAHTRVQQHFNGVPVFGGEAIVHLRSNADLFSVTDDLVPDVNVNTTPRLTSAEAIASAVAEYGCSDCLTAAPTADLWILPRDGLDHLAYRVQLRREDGTNDTALPVIFVDAHSGAVVWRYDDLQTGRGSSLYSGAVAIGTSYNSSTGVYVMENLNRRVGTFDMRTGTSSAFRFLDSNDVWDASAQGAGVDAQFGAEKFLDYLLGVHGWDGVDGVGGPLTFMAHDGSGGLISSRVHYGSNYANAFWNGSYMTYGDGDGSTFSPLVTLDIAGHEMMHGVTQHTANLIYSGESGALNESWSDVFGAMNERYVRGESANTWLLAEEAFTPGLGGDGLRYMDDPHRAPDHGLTLDDDPDHYLERYLGWSDNGGVHINSGIPNKAFYLLARGGSHHMGGSMTGIGADAAAQIWFVALRSYMTSSTNFAGARTATLSAAAALYGTPSTQYAAVARAWCLVGVGGCSVPTADSVTPSSGSGPSQSFLLRYSDSAGAMNLATAWVWFNQTVASSANSCLIQYDRPANQVRLLNDAGTTWSSATPATSATLQNSQCAVDLSFSLAVPNGNTLDLTLAVTFKPAFAGQKNIHMYAANGVAGSGWQLRGTWLVTAVVATVTADSVTPNSGSGLTQTFALQYSNSLDATDISTAWVWFNATFASNAAASCLAYYERSTNSLRLINDAGNGWLQRALGAGGTLQNSQCAIAVGSSSAVPSGNVLLLNLAITFKSSFSGAKNVYMYASSLTGTTSGWQTRGTWDVPAPSIAVVTADSATPNSGSGATQTFALRYSDTLGAADLSTAWVWFNATFASTAAGSCLIYYEQSTNTLRLINDAGTGWHAVVLSGTSTLENSQCAIALGSSTAVPSGNALTLTLAVTFKASFNGAKNIYMYAAGTTSANSGWQTRGTWTVPGTVTADSATPNSGAGATQTFALQYSHILGAANLSSVWVWFNTTFASTAANSCLIYYEQSTNTLRLINDAGNGWLAAVLGGGGTLQNSQCAIDVGPATVTPVGNTLTLSLPMTFPPTFAGAKSIFMYATGAGGANSGWQTRGSWTVP